MRYTELSKLQNSKFKEYFASQDVDECVARSIEKIEEYYAEMNRTGRINLYRNSYYKFYQGFIMKGSLWHSGQEGELINTFVNHYANLITHTTNLVCQQKLAYEPQALSNDSGAQDQIKLAKGILYAYANRSDLDLDGVLRKATDVSQWAMESFVSVLWNKNKGRTIATPTVKDDETGEESAAPPIKEGENDYRVWTRFDVITDTTLSSYDQRSWIILRNWENKFDVAAEYPEWADDICNLYTGSQMNETQLTYALSQETDLIPIYYLFHEKTPAVPEGRLVKFIDDRIILADGELGYREIPVYRMAMRDLLGSPYAYSRAADLLPLQDAVDRLCSAIITNQLTFATQNIAVAKGSDIAWEVLYGGLNLIEYPPEFGEAGIPRALQLTSSPPETFNFIKQIVADMGTLYGINEVVRGNPDLALKGQVSGAALALMTSNSIQFNSDVQKAYVRLAEQVGTATIHNLQDFAFPDLGNGQTLSRDGMTLSATNKYFKKSYTKTDLDKIDKIIVRYGNPLAQTTSGRMQIAESFIQQGMIKTPQEYQEVMEMGSLDPVFESQEAELHLIKEENEALMRGEEVSVLWCDNHALHFPEHIAKLSSLDARKNPKVIQAIKNHTDQHLNALKTLDPITAAFLKQPVLNQPQPPASPSPAPGSPPAPPQGQNTLPPKPPVPMGVA